MGKDYFKTLFLAQMYLFRLIPESKLKYWIRKQIIKIYKSLPAPLAVNNKDTVLQLGCWRTETMENWSKLVGDNGTTIIVEADPDNFKILSLEKKRRELHNVILINKGVWHSKGKANLQVSELSKRNKLKDADAYTPMNPDENYSELKKIEVDSVDNILDSLEINRVNHIQMEISGAEIEAIQGMNKILGKHGTRIHIRSILIQQSTGIPLYLVAEEKLKSLNLKVFRNKKEKNRDGSNIYAIKNEK